MWTKKSNIGNKINDLGVEKTKKVKKVSVLHNFSNKKSIDLARYKAMRIVFVFSVFLFFINFYLLGANFYFQTLIIFLPFTYVFLLISVLFYLFLLIKIKIQNKIVISVLILILFIFFILLLLPLSFRGDIQEVIHLFGF